MDNEIRTPQVTKNTMISVGLLVSMVTAFVYAEHRMTSVEAGLNTQVEKVKEIQENYVPRKEYESNFNSLQKQLDRIEVKIDNSNP